MAESSLDDSSHYEVSLTPGQAFFAFVLLLLSLAASFAFGIMIGKGQIDDRLVVRREPLVVNESSATRSDSRIVELGVPDESEFSAAPAPSETADPAAAGSPAIIEEAAPDASSTAVTPQPEAPSTTAAPVVPAEPVYAQVLSSSDKSAAESLAARLIEQGFQTAYVERQLGGAVPVYRVRVKFGSEADARSSVDRLKSITRSDVWITKQ